MNATAPHKPPIILATPINVEESRAQRLQRQQARFRDRGGIFVPTNRSTLVDILLGKASPLKKPRRSASASPSRANKEKSSSGNEISKPVLRRSPRKQSQKILDVVTEEQPPAITDNAGSEVSKPVKKATSSETSKSRPQKKAKAPPNRTRKSGSGASVVDTPIEKASKRAVDPSEKKSTKKIIPNADDDSEDDFPLVKPKPKGKAVSKSRAQEADGIKRTSKPRGRKSTTATISEAVTSSTQLEQTKKVEPVYAEDDTACLPTKKAGTKRVKKSAAPLEKTISKTSSAQKEYDEHNSEKDGSPSSQGVAPSLLKDKLVVARLTKSLIASDDDGDNDIPLIKPKSKSKVFNSQGKLQEIDGAKPRLKPTKKAESELSEDDPTYKLPKKSTKKMSEDDVACKPTKRSTGKKVKASAAPSMETEQCKSSSSRKGKGASNVNETAPCQVPDIPEADEERDSGKEDTAPSKSTANAVVIFKGKKRASASVTQDLDSQPHRKRTKSETTKTDIDSSLHKTSTLSDEAPLVTSKKRRQNPEDAESGVEGSVDKGTKRKKHSGPSESSPEITIEEDSVKPAAKRSSKTKVTKSTRKGKKQSSDATTASKRKENGCMFKSSKKVASNSGPPKSVLKRIKDSLGAQVVDNEPDPIDFLS